MSDRFNPPSPCRWRQNVIELVGMEKFIVHEKDDLYLIKDSIGRILYRVGAGYEWARLLPPGTPALHTLEEAKQILLMLFDFL